VSAWDDFPRFFEWGDAKEVEGGLVARRAPDKRRRGEPELGVGTVLLETLAARTTSGVVQRGRSYARKGQTVALTIEPGVIRASVQGASDDPYTVELTCEVTSAATTALIETLARTTARPDVVIPAHGLPALNAALAALDLLRGGTVGAHCTCPYGGVCKHCIAVAIVAGERLDESPKAVAILLGVTEAMFATDAPRGGPARTSTPAAPAPAYAARQQARLAKTWQRLAAGPTPDRDAVIAAAIDVLRAPDSVRRVLDLPSGD
jgi:uncharacterized Zn finger protein